MTDAIEAAAEREMAVLNAIIDEQKIEITQLRADLASLPNITTHELTVLQERIDHLTRCNETQMERLNQTVANHQHDIKLIGDRFNREAAERGWCSEYNDVIDELNEHLNIELAPVYGEVTVSLYYRVRVDVTMNEARTAGSDDDLGSQAYGQVPEARIFKDVELDDATIHIEEWHEEIGDRVVRRA